MRRLLLIAVIAATALPTLLSATSKSYDIVPYSNCVSQTNLTGTNRIQYVRNTLDSLVTASVWVGDTLSSQLYMVEIRDSATDQRVAYNNGFPAHQCWTWLSIPLTKDAQPVRGRTYYVKIYRSGGGGISFAYDPRNPYRYGKAVADGSTPSLTDSDDVAAMVAA